MHIIPALLLWSVLASGGAPREVDPTFLPEDSLKRVYQQYPYVTYRGKLFTFETEFTWPEGYHRPKASSLSPFQHWVSYMPIWHREVGVASPMDGDIYTPEQISRAIHLPWRTPQLRDVVIPLQVLAEYLLMEKREHRWSVHLKNGDSLTYDAFLSSTPVYDARDNLMFRPTEKRQPDSIEFDGFFSLVARNTDYRSLEANADSISADQLRPGDLLISRNEQGDQGSVYVIVLEVQNDNGEKRYIAATGCPKACDFYIPLFHNDRSNPWLTLDEVKALAPEQYPIKGFFRPHVPN